MSRFLLAYRMHSRKSGMKKITINWMLGICFIGITNSAFAESCLELYQKNGSKYQNEIELMSELDRFKDHGAAELVKTLQNEDTRSTIPEITKFFVSYSVCFSSHDEESPLRTSFPQCSGFTETAAKLVLHYQNNEFCKNPARLMALEDIRNIFFLTQAKKGILKSALAAQAQANQVECLALTTGDLRHALSELGNTEEDLAKIIQQLVSADPEQLFDQGKRQEALWLASERGDLATAKKLREEIERGLTSDDYDIVEANLGGVSKKNMLKFKDGTRALFKTEGNETSFAASVDSEVAAYKLSELLGFNNVPVTVPKTLRTGEKGSLQYFLDDTIQGEFSWSEPKNAGLLVLDYLSGNSDRRVPLGTKTNQLNILKLKSNGKYIAIDNGLAFRGFVSAYEQNGDIKPGGYVNDGAAYQFSTDAAHSLVQAVNRLPSQVKEKILGTTRDQVQNILSPLVPEGVLERVLKRLSNIQRVLKGHPEKIVNTFVPASRRNLRHIDMELFGAVRNVNPRKVEILLKAGADPNAQELLKGGSPKVPIDYIWDHDAPINARKHVARLLLQAGSRRSNVHYTSYGMDAFEYEKASEAAQTYAQGPTRYSYRQLKNIERFTDPMLKKLREKQKKLEEFAKKMSSAISDQNLTQVRELLDAGASLRPVEIIHYYGVGRGGITVDPLGEAANKFSLNRGQGEAAARLVEIGALLVKRGAAWPDWVLNGDQYNPDRERYLKDFHTQVLKAVEAQ